MILYLVSDDYVDFQIVRTVQSYRHISIEGIEALEVITDIPLIGQRYGLGDFNPNTFYLVNRFKDNNLHNLNSFPIAVYVYIVKNKDVKYLTSNTLQLIAWAELYNNYNNADATLNLAREIDRKGYIG